MGLFGSANLDPGGTLTETTSISHGRPALTALSLKMNVSRGVHYSGQGLGGGEQPSRSKGKRANEFE